MKPADGGASRRGPEEASQAIERFLDTSRKPTLHEPGEDPIVLAGDNFAVELRGGRLTLEAWDARRNLARRVIAVESERPGRLELAVERFGKRPGKIILADAARPSSRCVERRSVRHAFLEQFRRFLRRQFPGWNLAELSADPDLEHSLSPVYPRGFLKKGNSGWAAIAAPPAGDAAGVLSFGLIWLDYLRHRNRRLAVEGLALFVPHGGRHATCWRLRKLHANAAKFMLFVYSDDFTEQLLDARDWGNLETRLDARAHVPRGTEIEAWIERLAGLPHVSPVETNDGVSLRVRGLEFARLAGGELRFGLAARHPANASNVAEIERLAGEIARLRSPEARDRGNPICARNPEAWLESQVRAHLAEIDPALLAEPVYAQAPTIAGGERGVIDLLAAETAGRLAVLELKAAADIHLPLQALDYWMRVAWHLERGEFAARGYFPGIALSAQPPRMLLVAPALEFHPTTEVILRYFSPEIEVERVGLGVEWQRKVRVMFRLRGACHPV